MPGLLDYLQEQQAGLLPATIRYNNPGGMWPGPSASKFGATGYGVIGGGNKIANFPDKISGAAAQFDLFNRNYGGLPLNRALAKWSGGNNVPDYLASVVKDTGLSPTAPVTREMLADPAIGIPLAMAMSKHETKRRFPLSEDEWQQAHSMAFGATGSPAGLPVQSRDLPTEGLLGDQMPANAQPTQGQLPQQQPGFLERFADSLNNPLMMFGLGLASGKTPQEGIGNALQSLQFQQALQQRNRLAQSSDDIREYEYAKSQGFQGTLGDWIQRKRAGAGEYGLQGIWGTNKDTGEQELIQLGKSGEAIRSKLPEGFTPSKGVEKVDLGDSWGFVDKQTGQTLRIVPKNLVKEESEKKIGAGAGESYLTLQKDVKTAIGVKATLDRISQLSDDAYEGAAAPVVQQVRSVLATFGVDPGKVPAGEEFTALSNRVVLDATGGSLGNQISNADVSFLEATVPNMAQTKEGRKQLIETLRKTQDRKIEVGKMAREYRAKNGSLDGFEERLADYTEKNPLFSQDQKPAQSGSKSGGTEPPANAIKALRSNPALRDQFDAKYGPGAADRYMNSL